MTATIEGFVTREAAGLIDPRSVSKNITPEEGGVSEHYGGFAQSAAEPDADHSLCIKVWRSWQRFHMFTRGWVDIAYTGGFCNHGYAFAGRGAYVRTAANGTNDGNQNHYAIVWIGGEGQTPTQLAFDAADWWLVTLRKKGAGLDVRPHDFFKGTACPGDPIRDHAASRHGKARFEAPAPAPKPEPTAPTVSSWVKRIQAPLEVTVDGMWGPKTDGRAIRMRTASRAYRGWPVKIIRSFDVKDAQSVIDTPVDGVFGPNSQEALVEWIKEFQKVLNVKSDGWWGPKTDGKFLSVRRRFLNKY